MVANSVNIGLQIRRDTAANWTSKNPILREGEYGLETDTKLIKIGDGSTNWIHLPYLNKLNDSYFQQDSSGAITFTQAFLAQLEALETAKRLSHTLTFGAHQEYVFDGSQDVTVPVYDGTIY